MLYVRITDAEKGTKRSSHRTDDPSEAAAAALSKFLKDVDTGEAVLAVVVERGRKPLSGIAIGQELVRVAEAEIERKS